MIWIVIQIVTYRVEIGHCSLQAFFQRKEGKYLANNVLKTQQTASELDCAGLCSRERSCVSVNYKKSGENQGLCELNTKTLEDSKENVVEMSGFINLQIIKRVCFQSCTMLLLCWNFSGQSIRKTFLRP